MVADTPAPGFPPTDLKSALRAARMASIARLLPFIALGNAAAVATMAFVFWQNGPQALLVSVPVLVVTVYSLILLDARTVLATTPDQVAAADGVFSFIAACIVGIACGSLPAVLIPHADPSQLMIIGGLNAALMSGSAMAAERPAVALGFLVPVAGGVLLGVHNRPGVVFPLHGLAVAVYAAVTAVQIMFLQRRHRDGCLDRFALEEQRALVKLLLSDFESAATDWLWEFDADGYLQRIPDRLVEVSGVDRDTIGRISVFDQVREGAVRPGPARQDFQRLLDAWRKNEPYRDIVVPLSFGGREFWGVYSGKPVRGANGMSGGYRGVGSDVTSARASAARIEYLARHDALTGLPNRAVFAEALDAACRRDGTFCVLYLDLDRFKAVNDTHGHAMGDRVLRAAAGVLCAGLREQDLVARIGGDEFAILLADTGQEAAQRLAVRLIDNISVPLMVDGMAFAIGASVGIAPAGCGIDGAALMHAADLALYEAKASARGGVRVFDAAMAAAARARAEMLLDLRGALDRGEIRLVFQPIVSLHDDKVVAVEALARWRHPRRGDVPPADFIAVAEEGGLIGPLGGWVLRAACAAAAGLPDAVRMAVNVSAAQLRAGGLVDAVRDALQASFLPPARLELEWTETVFLDASPATQASLHALHGMGVTMTLDDFGSGHSSLSDLRSFPFDAVKVDQAFVRDLAPDQRPTMVQAMVQLAANLGMRTVAEGVETRQQLDMLRTVGCECAQGFLLAHPVEAAALAELVDGTGRIRTSQVMAFAGG
jgi:diguanylate cyclase (GGDEF)-like protein